MFGLGISEIMMILVVALLVIGPKNLPKVARYLGTFFGQAQSMMNDLQSTVRQEMADLDQNPFDDLSMDDLMGKGDKANPPATGNQDLAPAVKKVESAPDQPMQEKNPALPGENIEGRLYYGSDEQSENTDEKIKVTHDRPDFSEDSENGGED